MTEPQALAACPFCGSTNIDAHGWRSLDASGPACDDCGASAGQVSADHAANVIAWNQRTRPEPSGAPGGEVIQAVDPTDSREALLDPADAWGQVGFYKERLRQWIDECAVWKERAMTLRLTTQASPKALTEVAPFAWTDGVAWHKPAHRAVMASVALGAWLSAALDDPAVCEAMKIDIREWFSAGEPMEILGQALASLPQAEPAGDLVERVARVLAVHDGIQICSDASYRHSSYGIKAKAALSAIPTASGEVGPETFASIIQWGDETFGPCDTERAIFRAGQEWSEMVEPDADIPIEAADVIICLLRVPGIAEAIQRKMAINRARKWKLMGDGTGYHIPTDHRSTDEVGK